MEKIVRDVSEIESPDRQALEHMLGHRLREGEQIMFHVIKVASSLAKPEAPPAGVSDSLPDWCRVYEGLSDQEIAEIEEVVLDRAVLTRPSATIGEKDR